MKGNKRSRITLVILVLVLLISIGYAALTTVLKINSDIRLSKVTFGIHFDNVQPAQHKAIVDTEAYILDEETKKEISFAVSITQLEDYYRFTTDIVNEGSIPGVISSIELQGLTESQKKLINYKLTYTASGKKLAVGDYFGPHSTKNVTVDVIYELAEDIDDADLPEDDVQLQCVLVINFTNGSIGEFRARAASSKLTQSTLYMSSGSINFGLPAASGQHDGVYILDRTANDDFPIYFYRGGANTKNNVLFGGFCWRIIRTTDDGGIKIIYNGTPTEDNQCRNIKDASTFIRTSGFGGNYNYTSSTARGYLESWYFENLIRYQAYLEDNPFCNMTEWTKNSNDLSCPDDRLLSVANGRISYPIGLITAPEALLTGVAGYYERSNYPFLATDGSGGFWTMTGLQAEGGYVWSVSTDSYIYNNYQYNAHTHPSSYKGLRPVVALSSEVEFKEGDGSFETPYIPSLS